MLHVHRFTGGFVPTVVKKNWHINSTFKSFDRFKKGCRTSLLFREERSPTVTSQMLRTRRRDTAKELANQVSQNPNQRVYAKTTITGSSLKTIRYTSRYHFYFTTLADNLKVPGSEQAVELEPAIKQHGNEDCEPEELVVLQLDS